MTVPVEGSKVTSPPSRSTALQAEASGQMVPLLRRGKTSNPLSSRGVFHDVNQLRTT